MAAAAAGATTAPAPKKAAAKAPAPAKEVATVKASALSVEVGPAILAGLDKTYKDESKAREIMEGVESKRYDLLSQATLAIVKAAKADDSIDLSAAFSGDAKKMNLLNDQIGLALGFREVTETAPNKDGVTLKRIGYSKAAAKFFPTAKDDKKAPETVRKATLRSNFLHLIKKCEQAAAGIIDKGLTVSADKASGTLQLSGPAIEKQFGSKSVLLNEKQTVGDGEAAVKLKEKPSFTAIARMGAEAAGKTLTTRKQSGVSSNAVDPDTAIASLCKSLTDAIAKINGKPTEKMKTALTGAQSAIAKALS